jgi:hypothetical protein
LLSTTLFARCKAVSNLIFYVFFRCSGHSACFPLPEWNIYFTAFSCTCLCLNFFDPQLIDAFGEMQASFQAIAEQFADGSCSELR